MRQFNLPSQQTRQPDVMKDINSDSFFDTIIIGCGPTTVLLLDHLFRVLADRKSTCLRIAIIHDKKYAGCGVHSLDTMAHARLNRIAGQIALSSAPEFENAKDPSRLAIEKNYHYTFMGWAKTKYQLTGDINYQINQSDWPPRYLLGEALHEQITAILASCKKSPELICVDFIHGLATDVCKIGNGYEVSVKKDDKSKFSLGAANIVFATGTQKSQKHEPFHMAPYPLQNVAKAAKEHNEGSIVVEGGGATGIDVLNTIYLANDKLNVTAVTRTGLICHARPINEKLETTSFYKNQLFRRENIIRALQSKVERPSDEPLLCLLALECLIATCKFLCASHFKRFLDGMFFDKEKDRISLIRNAPKLAERLDAEAKLFFVRNENTTNVYCADFRCKLEGFANSKNLAFEDLISIITFNPFNYLQDCYVNRDSFKTWDDATEFFLWFDMFNARCGNLTSIFKFISDGVFRDGRQQLMKLLDDYSGYDEKVFFELHSFVTKVFLPIHNRVADGSPIESIEPLLKKIQSKNLLLMRKNDFEALQKSSEDGQEIEVCEKSKPILYVRARNPTHLGFITENPLFQNLIKSGTLSEFRKKQADNQKGLRHGEYNAGLITDQNFNPISNNGKATKSIFFLGASSEGTRQFNHTLGRPDTKYPVRRNVEIVVKQLLKNIAHGKR